MSSGTCRLVMTLSLLSPFLQSPTLPWGSTRMDLPFRVRMKEPAKSFCIVFQLWKVRSGLELKVLGKALGR